MRHSTSAAAAANPIADAATTVAAAMNTLRESLISHPPLWRRHDAAAREA